MSIDQWEERAAVIADAERWRWIAPRLAQVVLDFDEDTHVPYIYMDDAVANPLITKAQADAAVDEARTKEEG
jgi:hypothetical protein